MYDKTGLSDDAVHVHKLLENAAWRAERDKTRDKSRAYQGETIASLVMSSEGGVALTEFSASRMRKAIGELYGAGIVRVTEMATGDEERWALTTHEYRKHL